MESNLISGKSARVIFGKISKKDDNDLFVTENDFLSPPLDTKIDALAMNEINRITRLSINGKSVPELITYEDTSLWWFIYSPLIVPFIKIINFITHFSEFVEQVNPHTLKVEDDFNTFDILKQFCVKRKIKLEFSKIEYIKFVTRKKIWRLIRKYGSKRITKLKIKNRKNLFYKKRKSIPNIDNKIIFSVLPIYHRPVFNPNKKTEERGEWLVQNIINLLNDEKNIVCIDLFSEVRENEQILSERLESKLPWFPVELLFKNKNNSKHNQFFGTYKAVISSDQFHELFQFNGISLWHQLEDVFEKMKIAPYLPYWLELIDSLKFYFKTHKPRAIFLPYEYGPLALSFITASHLYGIKTVGISHATIYKNILGYSHKEFASSKNPYGFPLPDVTLLFGNHDKEVLRKQGYPPERFEVFGKSDFFNLDKIETSLATRSLYKKFKIEPNQKVILLTTQMSQEFYTSRGKSNYDTQIWKHLLENFLDDQNFTIILKPHPGEKNIRAYEKILKETNNKNAQIIQGDLFELIYVSSLVISIYSNSMVDAIFLKKPVVMVKFGNFDHPIPFEKYGVVLSTKLDNLSKKILDLLGNNKTKEELEKNRTIFIKELGNLPEKDPKVILEKILYNK